MTGAANILPPFVAVNIASVRLARDTGGRTWISAIAALSTAIALIVLCVKVEENPATRNHLWILLGMIVATLGIELVYRGITGRQIHLMKEPVADSAGTATQS